MTYQEATAREAKFRKAADEAASERAYALAEMYQSGMSYGKIAKATGLSRSRVQQLVERGTPLLERRPVLSVHKGGPIFRLGGGGYGATVSYVLEGDAIVQGSVARKLKREVLPAIHETDSVARSGNLVALFNGEEFQGVEGSISEYR